MRVPLGRSPYRCGASISVLAPLRSVALTVAIGSVAIGSVAIGCSGASETGAMHGAAATRAPANSSSGAPGTSAGVAGAPTAASTNAIEDIRALSSLLRVLARDDPRRPTSLARLADRYSDAARAARDAAIAIDERVAQVPWAAPPATPTDEGDAPPPEPPPNAAPAVPERDATALARVRPDAARELRRSDELLVRARATWQRLIEDHPNTARLDDAIYAFAEVERSLGRPQAQRAALVQLIRRFPSSPRAAEAYLVFADYFFEQGRMADARLYYDRVLQLPAGRVTAYARYRLAWVFANSQDPPHALETLRAALVDARATSQEPLVRSILRELPQFFAATHGPTFRVNDAVAMFDAAAALDRDRATRMLVDLLAALRDANHLREALDLVHVLLARAPERRCEFQRVAIEIATALREPSILSAEHARMAGC